MGQSAPCGQYQIPGVSETEYCTILGTKVGITKTEISMRTWRSPMSAASQSAFVVIPEISLCDISGIIKKLKKGIDSEVKEW